RPQDQPPPRTVAMELATHDRSSQTGRMINGGLKRPVTLSPWLGHLMVTRHETARPLLTPGEIMQLPPDEELVLVSGCPPIRARKARYFEDAELAARILLSPRFEPPSAPEGTPPIGPQPSGDWADVVQPLPASNADDDPANAGIRREPELPEQEEVVQAPRKPVHEFDPPDEEPEDDARRAQTLRRGEQVLARQVSLDPGDRMGL
ncbi:type IV secretory system conjugative DNA transfer family protein, partial [Brytella acorum]